MFFPIYIILFTIIPFFFKELSLKEKRIHLNITVFLIFFLAVISLNGPDYTTYRKNFYTFSGNLDSVKFFDYFFQV